MRTSSCGFTGSLVLYHGQFYMFRKWTSLPVQMLFKLLAKLLHESQHRHRRRIPQRAKRPAQHIFRKVLNVVDVLSLAEAGVEARQRLLEPVRSLAEWDAPAAALM